MKFLAVFAAIMAVALGARSHWTLDQLSNAIEDPNTNPSLVPILEQALNAYMEAMFAGESHKYISITTAPVDLSTWSLSELSEALENPNTNPALMPHLEHALNALMNAIFAGEVEPAQAQAAIVIPALEISYWTLADIDQALASPFTHTDMVPYLKQALDHIMENLINGVQQTAIVLATPIMPEIPIPVIVPEVVVAPEVVDPVQVVDGAPSVPVRPVVVNPGKPVLPSPVSVVDGATGIPSVSGSPLVQIIVNINQESAAPSPATVDNTEAFPNPRPPVPEPAVVPEMPAFPNPRPPAVDPDFNPIDGVAISPPEVNPIEVIAVQPPEINPIEVIAVSPPEINPIEVIAVSPPEINPIEGVAISPPEVNPIEVIAVQPPEINPIEVIAVSPPEINPIEVIAVSPPEINPIEVIAVQPPEFNPIDILHPVPVVEV